MRQPQSHPSVLSLLDDLVSPQPGLTGPLVWLLISCLLIFSGPLRAAPASDRSAPTKVDSDQLKHDEKKALTVFTGNVVLSKGSLLMRGDRLELQQMPDGSSLAVLRGNPAQMRQRRAADNEWMVGHANQIDYDSQTEISVLTGNAVMRRLSGETEKDRIAGDRLVYSSTTEVYEVQTTERSGRATMSVMPSTGRSQSGAGR